MKVYSYWKCPSCQNIIKGECRECPSCGQPIPSDVKYMMPNNSEVISALASGSVLTSGSAVTRVTKQHVDEKGIVSEIVPDELASDKPNWNCTYCGFQNRFEDTSCRSCGAGKEQAEFDYFFNKPVMDEDNCKDYERRTGLEYKPDTPREEPSKYKCIAEPQSLSERILDFLYNNGKTIAQIAAVICTFVFLVWLFFPITRTAKIEGFEWERSIAVEEYKLCHESDWSVPSGGKVTSQQQEIHHYDSVLDHYETKTREVAYTEQDGYDTSYRDLGNGQAEVVETPRYVTRYRTETYEEPVYRQEPVYKTKYYYDIGRWKEVGSLNTSGCDQNPYWHETDLPKSVSNPTYGERCQGDRSEKYSAIITDEKGNSHSVDYGYSEWSEYKIGDEITYKTFRFSQKPL